jgi:site-specific DNA-methyltransferase (adenine-specific)
MKDIELRQGDCLELMKDIPDGSVDLTVTSPPYDNLRTYKGNIDQWNFEKFKAIAKELFRVTAPGGVVVWVVTDATIKGSETGTSFRQALWFKECGFNIHDTMIWLKDGGGACGSKKCYTQNFEYMFVFSKGKPKTVNLIRDRKNSTPGNVHKQSFSRTTQAGEQPDIYTGRSRVTPEFSKRNNWWLIERPTNNRTGHPAVFPEQIANDHIVSWSNEGDTVLDCFMGSGTTGVSCVNTGRRFIGMELDQGYFEIAKNRVNDCLKQIKIEI